jgi:hypothetical protein
MSYDAPAVFYWSSGQIICELGQQQAENRIYFALYDEHESRKFEVKLIPDGRIQCTVQGDLMVLGEHASTTIGVDGSIIGETFRHEADGVLNLGRFETRGYMNLFNSSGQGTIAFDGETGQGRFNDRLDVERVVVVGRGDQAGLLQVLNNRGEARCELNGETGRVGTVGRDCAELFDTAEGTDAEPGTVMVIDDDRTVRPSEVAYDKRVAGVVSGAGSTQPGILLGMESARSVPIALAGTVTVKMTADERPVEVGDLVVSSAATGHAMAAEDPTRSFGAVIGKALGSLRDGQGLVPILVSLQ